VARGRAFTTENIRKGSISNASEMSELFTMLNEMRGKMDQLGKVTNGHQRKES
jgi:hypothetical protein